MKKLVLGIGLCSSVIASACPSGLRCVAGVVALVGLTIAGCTNNPPPPANPGQYYTPSGPNSNYSSSYNYSSETVNGQTTESFSGQITEDGNTRSFDNAEDFNRSNQPRRFAPPEYRFTPPE